MVEIIVVLVNNNSLLQKIVNSKNKMLWAMKNIITIISVTQTDRQTHRDAIPFQCPAVTSGLYIQLHLSILTTFLWLVCVFWTLFCVCALSLVFYHMWDSLCMLSAWPHVPVYHVLVLHVFFCCVCCSAVCTTVLLYLLSDNKCQSSVINMHLYIYVPSHELT